MRRAVAALGPFLIDPACHMDFRQVVPREDRLHRARGRLGVLERMVTGDETEADAPPLTSKEAVQLLDTFTASQDTESALSVFRVARRTDNFPMLPAHYNALARGYAYNRERGLLHQCLHVAAHNGAVNMETVALATSSLHHFGVRDRLPSLLHVIELLTRAGVPLARPNEPRDEAEGLPELTHGTFGRSLTDESGALPNAQEGGSQSHADYPFVAPVLSSLLHSVSTGPEGPVATVLVACWIRAAGAELSTWDYVNVLVALERDTECFPHLKDCFNYQRPPKASNDRQPPSNGGGGEEAATASESTAGSSSQNQPDEPGTFKLPQLVGVVRRWAKNQIAAVHVKEERRKVQRQLTADRRAGRAGDRDQTKRSSGSSRGAVPSKTEYDPLDQAAAAMRIAEAMLSWWEATIARTGVARSANVYVGFVNTNSNTLEHMIRQLFDEASRRKVILPSGDSFLKLHHASAIVHQMSSNKISAALELRNAWRRWQEWEARYASSPPGSSSDGGGSAAGNSPGDIPAYVRQLELQPKPLLTSSLSLADRIRKPNENAELVGDTDVPVDNWFVKEVANFFPEVPAVVRQQVGEAYAKLCDRAVASENLNDSDQKILWALSQPLMAGPDEAAQAVEYVRDSTLKRQTMFKAAKHMVRSLITTASLHPPVNPKLTATGISERHRWGQYLDARDIALTLFGATRNGREQMKALYHNSCRFEPLRSLEAIRGDVREFGDIFATAEGGSASSSRVAASLLESDAALTDPRVLGRIANPVFAAGHATYSVVPPHMADPKVPNPYPQAGLRGGRPLPGMPDIFPEVQKLLNALSIPWWNSEPDTVLALLRCHLHRLDWEGAIAVAEAAFKVIKLTAVIDAEIQRIFDEIGDPIGAMPFKVAAKLVDMRITGRRTPGDGTH